MEKKSSVSLEVIQEMWQKDSEVNQDELDTESLKIPQLHAKYYQLYNTILLLRKQAEQQHSSILLERRKFYMGTAETQVYIDEPFPYKVRDKEDLKLYLEADEKISKIFVYKTTCTTILKDYTSNCLL